MRRLRSRAVLLLLLVGCCAAAPSYSAPDSLFYFGHSFVEIKTAGGEVIYIDPYAVNAFADSADIILVTHEHADHNEISRVRQKEGCQVIRAATALVAGVYQAFHIGDVEIEAVPAYNNFHPRASCVGYVLRFDGIRLYHAGDTGLIPEMANLDSLHLTYALLPMDGTYTMSPEAATSAAGIINAAHDMPIHTMAPPDTYSTTIVARFTSPHLLLVRPGEAIELQPVASSAVDQPPATAGFRLEQNYPNPFNPSTVLGYQIPREGRVSLRIFDVIGRLVAVPVDGEQRGGWHTVRFDASRLAAGIYFARLSAGSLRREIKMLLLK